MNKYIPLSKQSKKKQKQYHSTNRNTWIINPVSKKPANPKAYKRDKLRLISDGRVA